jgi:hypothetical protein
MPPAYSAQFKASGTKGKGDISQGKVIPLPRLSTYRGSGVEAHLICDGSLAAGLEHLYSAYLNLHG